MGTFDASAPRRRMTYSLAGRDVEMTTRQYAIFDYIATASKRDGFPPTVREIGVHFRIKNPNGIVGHLRALQEKSLIYREPGRSRAIRVLVEPVRPMEVAR